MEESRFIDSNALEAATKAGHSEAVKKIIEKILPIEFFNTESDDDSIYDFCKKHYSERFLWIKKACCTAARYDHVDILDYLFGVLRKINATDTVQDEINKTPLDHAIENNCHATVILLLKEKNVTKTRHPNRVTCLHRAIEYNRLEIAKLLINHDTSLINTSTRHSKQSPLQLACSYGDDAMVELLVSQGARLDTTKNNSYITQILSWLKIQSPQPPKPPKNTLLTTAVLRGSKKIVDILLKNGAHPNLQDENGNTALHYAVMLSFFNAEDPVRICVEKQIIYLLLDYGANTNIQNFNQTTPLMTAVCRGAIKIIDILLKNGAHPNLQDENGNTAFHCATMIPFDSWEAREMPKMVDLLLAYKADINIKNSLQKTPLDCIEDQINTQPTAIRDWIYFR